MSDRKLISGSKKLHFQPKTNLNGTINYSEECYSGIVFSKRKLVPEAPIKSIKIGFMLQGKNRSGHRNRRNNLRKSAASKVNRAYLEESIFDENEDRKFADEEDEYFDTNRTTNSSYKDDDEYDDDDFDDAAEEEFGGHRSIDMGMHTEGGFMSTGRDNFGVGSPGQTGRISSGMSTEQRSRRIYGSIDMNRISSTSTAIRRQVAEANARMSPSGRRGFGGNNTGLKNEQQ